jgi:hypothetical protein
VRKFALLFTAIVVVSVSKPGHADRFFPGGVCSPQILGAGSPAFPDGSEGHRVGPVTGAEHDAGLGTNVINCPMPLSETGDVSTVTFEVYGRKESAGRARCRGYAGSREQPPKFSLWRHMCAHVQGCAEETSDIDKHDSYVGDATLVISLPLSPSVSPFVLGVQCSLHATSWIRFVGHNSGNTGVLK